MGTVADYGIQEREEDGRKERMSRNSTTRRSSSMWYTVHELIKALLIVVTIQAMDAFFPLQVQ